MTTVKDLGGKHLWRACLLLLGILHGGSAQAFYNSYSALGTNTNEIREDDSSVPFVDLFKISLPFREASPLTKGDVQYDAYGWVSRLGADAQAGTRFLSKLPANTIPQGYYTVLYDGEGKLEYGNDARLVEHTAGRDVIMIEAGADKELNATLLIKATNPANYLRNIRILPQGGICASNPFQRVQGAGQCRAGDFWPFEREYSRIIFNPDYLTYMRDFRVIRFMNMSGITRNPMYAWEDRASIDQATWGGAEGIRGAPMEVMVELANRLHADPWFSLPHAASDDFVRRFADYVRVNLDPTLKVYVEYTNEAWNGIFTQHAYVKQQGVRLGLDPDPNQAAYKYYSQRSVEVFNIWEGVFGGNNRLVRVLSGLVGSTPMTKTILSYRDAYRSADAYAVAPYVYGDTNALRQARTVDDIFRIMEDPRYPHSLPNELLSIRKQAEMTKGFGLDLLAYEGGQHLVDWNTRSDNDRLNQLFYQANRDGRMGNIYAKLLKGWQEEGGKLFVHYTSPRTYRKYGSFGTKEYITQPNSQAPKYRAMLSFARDNRCWWEGCSGNTFVRHTKPATSLEAMKTLSEPLDNTAPQYSDAGAISESVARNTVPPTSPTDVDQQVASNTHATRVLVSMRDGTTGEDTPVGADAVVSMARSPNNPWQGVGGYALRSVVNGQIANTQDLAAVWQASWDQRHLYLRIAVEDDSFQGDSTIPWDDDAVEVYLDADGSGLGNYDGANDFHFIFSVKDNRVALGKNSPQDERIPMNHRVVREGKGYILEATIPWSALRVRPQAGLRLGLDIHVDDDDDGGARDGKLTWHDRQDDAWRNPNTFGRVVLGE